MTAKKPRSVLCALDLHLWQLDRREKVPQSDEWCEVHRCGRDGCTTYKITPIEQEATTALR